MDELARLLDLHCQRLEHIHYRATVAVLLLRGSETRFLPRSADELHDAVDQLSELELARATVVAGLAADFGVADDELTLERIIALAPSAAASRLRALQERLRAALSGLQELAGSGTVLATSELSTIRASLGRWSTSGTAAATYGVAPSVGPSRFDGSF